ncbi:MAG: twin-arginine translocase subunit TatC [Gammaproteobacteria bacterium]
MSEAKEDDAKEGLLGHLTELRTRLLRIICALLAVFVAVFPFAGELYSLLAAPLLAKLSPGGDLIAIGVLTPFMVQLTTAFFAAVVIALPYMFYEIWRFVAPGLYSGEKRLIAPLVISSTLLFFAGMVFAYFLVFEVVFGFIAAVTPEDVLWTPDISEFLAFAAALFLAFGAAFEMPVAVWLLVRSGAVTVEQLKKARPYIIVGAFVVAAIVTPPDVISQLLLAIPCWLLFELGLFLAPKKPKPPKENQ